jgi:hypothetical protein
MKKPSKKKERAKEYEKKLSVDATFDELVAISLGKEVPLKPQGQKKKARA